MLNSAPQINLNRPLVDLWTACAALDRSDVQVLALLESGKICFAWNIATRNAGARCVRILARSLAEFQAGKTAAPVGLNLRDTLRAYGSTALTASEQAAVTKEIFPVSLTLAGVETIKQSIVARRLNTSPEHIANLVREGELKQAKNTVSGRGRGNSPALTLASVADFLKRRRLV